MDEILDSLNERQREAVVCTEGPLLVLAGAGSGKTRVITHRFAHLLNKRKTTLTNILAVTFTNKAAGEMKERISSLSGLDASNSWVRTFHSTGVKILRRNPEAFGYPRDFVIYDSSDSKSLVRSIMKDRGINPKTFNPGGIAERISGLKDSLVTPEGFRDKALSELDKAAAVVFFDYEKTLRKNRAVDFPDLISIPIKIFRENENIRAFYQSLWQYVMIDEFQDTNKAQYELIRLFCPPSNNICAVGDDDQSIYGWRGANIDNINDFRSYYKAKIILLEQNYRSTGIILSAAHAVVEKIEGRIDKKLWTKSNPGEKITVIDAMTDKEEAARIVNTIGKLLATITGISRYFTGPTPNRGYSRNRYCSIISLTGYSAARNFMTGRRSGTSSPISSLL
jgi:DNA helicase-2/ATP-dependent DNA helicase PcrA